MSTEAANTVADFEPGHHVELHPATDRWMMGDRLGVVSSVSAKKNRVYVRLTRSNKVFPFHPDNILTKKNRNP